MQQLHRLIYRHTNYPLLIPFEGKVDVKVKKGENITPGMPLLSNSMKRFLSSYYIPSELGVKVEDSADYIVRLNGEYVLTGEILAERMVAGGFSMKRLYSVSDGILSLSRIKNGFVDILSENQEEEYKADFYGKVIDIDYGSGLSINTMVWEMPTLTDNYHEKPNEYKNVRIGKFEILGDASSVYVKKDLKDSYSGKIVFAGRFASPDILKEIYARGAQYVFVYSMDYNDFVNLNFSVGIIGGFGSIPYPREYIKIFRSMKDNFTSIDLQKNTIIWPDHGKYLYSNPNEPSSQYVHSLKPGMFIRTTDVENYRAVGRVLDTDDKGGMATVELEDGKRLLLREDTLVPLHL